MCCRELYCCCLAKQFLKSGRPCTLCSGLFNNRKENDHILCIYCKDRIHRIHTIGWITHIFLQSTANTNSSVLVKMNKLRPLSSYIQLIFDQIHRSNSLEWHYRLNINIHCGSQLPPRCSFALSPHTKLCIFHTVSSSQIFMTPWSYSMACYLLN